jgi:hypothetical protein
MAVRLKEAFSMKAFFSRTAPVCTSTRRKQQTSGFCLGLFILSMPFFLIEAISKIEKWFEIKDGAGS